MSGIFPKEAIKNTAETIGISNLKDNVANALAHDVEYRIYEIIQPLYGFGLSDNSKFQRVTNNQVDLYYMEDEENDFESVLYSNMPKVPVQVTFTCMCMRDVAHWLAVEGIQPTIPHNPPPIEDRKSELLQNTTSNNNNNIKQNEIKPLVQHVLSKELETFYNKVTNTLINSQDPTTVTASTNRLKQSILNDLESDTGLSQLVPYFVKFICEKVAEGVKRNIRLLEPILQMSESLINNNSLYLEPYLHQLMPAILTCILRNNLGVHDNSSSELQWQIRELAARIIAKICDRYGGTYSSLQTRITKLLIEALNDNVNNNDDQHDNQHRYQNRYHHNHHNHHRQHNNLYSHYGSIVTIGAMGREAIRNILVPNLKKYETVLNKYSNDSVLGGVVTRNYNAILDILSKLKESVDPIKLQQIQNTSTSDVLHEQLVNKVGQYFANVRELDSIAVFMLLEPNLVVVLLVFAYKMTHNRSQIWHHLHVSSPADPISVNVINN
nr:11160_t:CDS:10 [Entrophospora candida]